MKPRRDETGTCRSDVPFTGSTHVPEATRHHPQKLLVKQRPGHSWHPSLRGGASKGPWSVHSAGGLWAQPMGRDTKALWGVWLVKPQFVPPPPHSNGGGGGETKAREPLAASWQRDGVEALTLLSRNWVPIEWL